MTNRISIPAFAVAICAMNASAADAQETVVGHEEASKEGGLSEIIVTARKRQESVQDIPVSVTAFSAVQIERRDLTSIEKIAASTPQLVIGRGYAGSGAQITLRGIGSQATSVGIEQSVAVVVDGVYYGSGKIINEGFFDLARVELLKGPQALFFGKNATAGVVSITSADPSDKPEFKARLGYEFRAKEPSLELVGSVPLSDTLGLRVALRGTKMYGGYFKNTATANGSYTTTDSVTGISTVHVTTPAEGPLPQEREVIGRATLKWKPTDHLTAILKTSFSRNDTNAPGYNWVLYRCGNPAAVGCSTKKYEVNLQNLPSDIAKVVDGGRNNLYLKYRSLSTTGTIEYKLDDITITSVTNYNGRKQNWLLGQQAASNTWATEHTTGDALSSELRMLTQFESPVNFMIGGLYQKTKLKFRESVFFAGVENSAATPTAALSSEALRYVAFDKVSESNGKTLSAFGQIMWKFLPRFELAAGVRYTHETKSSFFEQAYVHPFLQGLFIPASASNGVLAADQTFNNWSPEATISFKPNRNINVYAAFKTAYKSGGFSSSGSYVGSTTDPLGDITFEPEKASGFEAGIKTTLLDNQLRLNFGIYKYKYKNLQVDFFNPNTFGFSTINAGTAITKGIESEFEFAPRSIGGLLLRGSLNLNRARYGSFQGPCYTGQTPSQGCAIIGPGGAPFQDLSGVQTAVAPKWTATLGFDYETAVSQILNLGFGVDTRYSSSYVASAFNQPLATMGKYIAIDANIRLRTSDDRWEFALIGKNLTNKLIIGGVVDNPGSGGGTGTPAGVLSDQQGIAGVPRTVQIQATFHY